MKSLHHISALVFCLFTFGCTSQGGSQLMSDLTSKALNSAAITCSQLLLTYDSGGDIEPHVRAAHICLMRQIESKYGAVHTHNLKIEYHLPLVVAHCQINQDDLFVASYINLYQTE